MTDEGTPDPIAQESPPTVVDAPPLTARTPKPAPKQVVEVVTDDDDDWGSETDKEPELISNGRIRFTVAGERFRLRRPNLGQLEELRERQLDAQDALAEVAKEAADAGILKDTNEGTDEEKADYKSRVGDWIEANKFNRKHRLSGTAEVAAFMARAVELLEVDGHRLPEGFNDWPIWLVRAGLVAEFLQHWQFSHPADPGSNGATSPGTTAAESPGPIAV